MDMPVRNILEPDMILVRGDGTIYRALLCGQVLGISEDGRILNDHNYDENLKYKRYLESANSNKDIVELFNAPKVNNSFKREDFGKLRWASRKLTTVNYDQIAKLFNVPVECLRLAPYDLTSAEQKTYRKCEKLDMSMEDIKTGMVVKLRNNQVYLALRMVDTSKATDADLLIHVSTGNVRRFKEYTSDMCYKGCYSGNFSHMSEYKRTHRHEWDVMEIYKPPAQTRVLETELTATPQNLIYKRDARFVVSLEQIAEIMNIPLEQLRVKR